MTTIFPLTECFLSYGSYHLLPCTIVILSPPPLFSFFALPPHPTQVPTLGGKSAPTPPAYREQFIAYSLESLSLFIYIYFFELSIRGISFFSKVVSLLFNCTNVFTIRNNGNCYHLLSVYYVPLGYMLFLRGGGSFFPEAYRGSQARG